MFDFILNGNTHIVWLIVGVIAGFVLIIYGGDYFVDSAIWIAKVTHIPEMIIGATIVSLGTTLPEIFVSFTAAASATATNGGVAMSVGNAVGSILCNGSLILAIAMAVSVSNVDRKEFLPKFIFLLISVVLVFLFAMDGSILWWQSAILVAVFVAFMAVNIAHANKQLAVEKSMGGHVNTAEDEKYKNKKPWFMILMFVLGAVGIAIGANLLISSVSGIALKLSIPTSVISLTVVAIGTSLPELITTLTAIRKKSNSISLGNIIGANIFNATLILGGSGIIFSVKNGGAPISMETADIPTLLVSIACIAVMLLIIGLPILIKKRTYRWQGISMLIMYTGYVAYLIYDTLTRAAV